MFPFLSCAPDNSPSMTINVVSLTGGESIDLTALGGADYQKVSGGEFFPGVRKASGGNLITVAEFDPNNVLTIDYENKGITFSGTDGDPFATWSGTAAARCVDFASHQNPIGYTITVPASNQLRTLSVWGIVYSQTSGINQAYIDVGVSDDSFGDYYQEFQFDPFQDNYFRLDISYRSASSATLTINVASITNTNTIRTVHYIATWLSSPS